MKKFFSILGVVTIGMMAIILTSCAQKKSEIPIGEIMANAATSNTALEQAATAAPTIKTTVAGETEVYMPGVTTEPAAVAVATASATPTPEEIQTALKNAGYYTGSIDGKIGPKSKKAIESFQKDNNLTADGKVGSKTWGKLKDYLNQAAKETVATRQAIAD